MNQRNRWAGYWFLAPYLILFSVFLLGPLIFGLALSFMQYDLASKEPARFVGLANYSEALDPKEGVYFRASLWATIKFVAFAIPLTIPLALFLAVAIDAARGTRQAIYRIGIFAPTVITVSVVGLMWRWFYNREFGLFNAMLGPLAAKLGIDMPIGFLDTPNAAMLSIVVMSVWWSVGGPVLVLLAGLKQIPNHYYEAAAIDGAVGWRAFWNITFPLLRPALLFTVVVNIIGAFQVFGQPFMVTAGGPERSTYVAMQYIYETAFRNYRLGYGAAMSWLLFLVIAAFAILQFRLMRDDPDDAGVKAAAVQRRPTR